MISALVLSAVSAALFAAPTLPAAVAGYARWDAFGHHAIAAIAYDRLRPATRARVDSLLRAHPDITMLGRGLDLRTTDGARDLFLRSSVWPDQIRRDPRFHDETDAAVPATPLLSGYPDMHRRAGWHYMSRSFSADGTPVQQLAPVNTVTRIAGLANDLADRRLPLATHAYNLSWVVHVVGDLHQPLHGTSRASRQLPNGDAGGNALQVQYGPLAGDSINLHAFWDGLLGRANRGGSAVAVGRELAAAMPEAADSPDRRIARGPALETALVAWADESETLARYVVYEVGMRADGAVPPPTSAAYVALATAIARQRITLAGYRLAALLELQLN